MIKDKIDIDGNEYILGKIIHKDMHTYVEYRNLGLGKMRFFEKKGENLKAITDKKLLRKIAEENYIVEKNMK